MIRRNVSLRLMFECIWTIKNGDCDLDEFIKIVPLYDFD